MFFSVLVYIFLVFLVFPTYAIDEDTLFPEDTVIVSGNTSEIPLALETIGFSGQLYQQFAYYSGTQNALANTGYGDFILDVRLQNAHKALLTLGVLQGAVGTTNVTGIVIKEMFVDFHIAHQLYVRSGKQVLAWGRNYFWNPTDMIQVEGRSFFDLMRLREGRYGLRLHAPGAMQNFYAYFDFGSAATPKDIAVALKYEQVFGSSEIGTSVWAKSGFPLLFGLDWSTSLFLWDLKGEWSLSDGALFDQVGADLNRYRTTGWLSRVSLGVSRWWHWDIPDRIQTHFELFYNGYGYTEPVFHDSARRSEIQKVGYRPNYLSAWYTASFMSLIKFPVFETTTYLNTLHNWVEGSHTLSVGIGYIPVPNMTIQGTLYGYFGSGEYVLFGPRIVPEMSVRVLF